MLRVFAAASLADAFAEIGEDFSAAHPGTLVLFNFGGSQNLRTQIEQGAQADLFASADQAEMQSLVEGGFIASDSIQIFARNTLTVLLPVGNPAGLRSVEDLARPGVKLVAAAEEVPAGRYARQALRNCEGLYGDGFFDRVIANIVSNEDNVRQVVAKVELGEADAGIVYQSDAAGVPGLPTLSIPESANVMAEYPIAPLVHASDASLAMDFIDFVVSQEGHNILTKWGFSQVGP